MKAHGAELVFVQHLRLNIIVIRGHTQTLRALVRKSQDLNAGAVQLHRIAGIVQMLYLRQHIARRSADVTNSRNTIYGVLLVLNVLGA